MCCIGNGFEADPDFCCDQEDSADQKHPSVALFCGQGANQTEASGRHSHIVGQQFCFACCNWKPNEQGQHNEENQQCTKHVDCEKHGRGAPCAFDGFIAADHDSREAELADKHAEIMGQERAGDQAERVPVQDALMADAPGSERLRREHAVKGPGQPIGRDHDQQENQCEGNAGNRAHSVN